MSQLIIRPARAADYPSFARLFPELRVGDPVPGEQRFCTELLPGAIMAEGDGRVLGYSYYQLIGATVYIRHVIVDPAARGGGVGAALMQWLRQHFRDHGAQHWELNVKPDNQVAIRLYERFGLRSQYRSTALGLSWDRVDSLAVPEERVAVRRVQPSDDELFERALRLLDGQLHGARMLPGRVVVGLVSGAAGTPAGIAVFDPAFPGASPFRVAHPSLVGALLAGLRPHALPGQQALGLFVEDDDAAVTALMAAGASTRLEALHYRGAL